MSLSNTRFKSYPPDKRKELLDSNSESPEIKEKDIQTVIQILTQTQLPDYAEGKTNEYYRNEYRIKHRDEIEEHKEDDPSGGKTQKKKKKKKKTKGVLRQRTIKNKV